ncbi:LytTR family DNA-binding domain-containing protein [Mucilaginibacter sp.]|uniref:LytR/AlgR family response regulator transcription factor n=1 Tax=Mucilaginibacter sp. TaxID=1882438 RepID=UPI00261C040B|nr:LytTR family DNA-binding domain-containing protein [Mucilaginibacter sp.]MDB5031805.1 response regulator of the LytR/AlgR family [Mucilaginibacter sp.]
MRWRCLIIDDDPIILKIIKKWSSMVEQLEVVAVCNSALQSMEIMKTERIDLLFLDIEMPELSGISFLRTLQNPPKVIFITAYAEFAAEAFDLNAVDFLLKPLSLERFLKAVNKVIDTGSAPVEGLNISVEREWLYLKANRKTVKIFLDEIVYVESAKDYIKIYTQLNAPLVIKCSLTAFEAKLPHKLFARVHRSFIVAINRITAFTNYDVELGKIEIPLGRHYLAQWKRLSKTNKVLVKQPILL